MQGEEDNPHSGYRPPSGAALENMQQMWMNSNDTPNPHPGQNSVGVQLKAINLQQNSLRNQIRQSEQNLSAQHAALIQQQQTYIDDAVRKAQMETLQTQAEVNGIVLKEFDDVLLPIVESCTKDSISTGKNWILQHTGDATKCSIILQYLLQKALITDADFSHKLHLIYLVNDVLHHCIRKNAAELKKCLENVVIPMFCSAQLSKLLYVLNC